MPFMAASLGLELLGYGLERRANFSNFRQFTRINDAQLFNLTQRGYAACTL